MNYQKIYDRLIQKRLDNLITKEQCYCETHHILPRCLGGSDDKSNLVNLTAREHFVAHKLLSHIAIIKYGNTSIQYIQLFYARFLMSVKLCINSREFDILRREQGRLNKIRFSGKNNPMYGSHRIGKLNPCYGYRWMYNEAKNKYVYVKPDKIQFYLDNGFIFKCKTPYIPNEKQKEQNRLKHLGKKHSIETKQKFSIMAKGKIRIINLKLDQEKSIDKSELYMYMLEDGWCFGRLFRLKRRFENSKLSIDNFYKIHIDKNTRKYIA